MTVYKISFTLEQEDDGEITPSLLMSPAVDTELFPDAFKQMMDLVEIYLKNVGIVDDEGNLLDENCAFVLEDAPSQTIN